MKHVCTVCGYVYDEEKEAAPFEELDEAYECPVCGIRIKEFQPIL
ncbi:MAG: rubredoxin [Christensenellales bacterium]|jgi:rubredoxin